MLSACDFNILFRAEVIDDAGELKSDRSSLLAHSAIFFVRMLFMHVLIGPDHIAHVQLISELRTKVTG